MDTSESSILSLLRNVCSKERNAYVTYVGFCEYAAGYARSHARDDVTWARYADARGTAIEDELNSLVTDGKIALADIQGRSCIFAQCVLIDRVAARYDEIELTITSAFPSGFDFPRETPDTLFTTIDSRDYFASEGASSAANATDDTAATDDGDDEETLYSVTFARSVSPLLVPSTLARRHLSELALRKIQEFLSRKESYEYFRKKIMISNPQKELSVASFYTKVCENPVAALDELKTSADNFYYWTQLFYFVRQDFTKIKSLSSDDITILQALAIAETVAVTYKNRLTEKQKEQGALDEVRTALLNPPYYFTMDQIIALRDKNGTPILSRVPEAALREFIRHLVQDSSDGTLPDLLVFKVAPQASDSAASKPKTSTGASGSTFYIARDRLLGLVNSLLGGVRPVIRDVLTKTWYLSLLDFQETPEMKNDDAFESRLESEALALEPVLAAVMHSAALAALALETKATQSVVLYRDGHLVPYSELLSLRRRDLLDDARLRLPVWYRIPFVFAIISALRRNSARRSARRGRKSSTLKGDASDTQTRSAALKAQKEKNAERRAEIAAKDKIDEAGGEASSRKRGLRRRALAIEKDYVPETSSLDRELARYMRDWNDRINESDYNALGDDVNALIRDYLRGVIKTFRSDTFNAARIELFADSLSGTPSMMKIRNHAALKRYIELYIIKIIEELP